MLEESPDLSSKGSRPELPRPETLCRPCGHRGQGDRLGFFVSGQVPQRRRPGHYAPYLANSNCFQVELAEADDGILNHVSAEVETYGQSKAAAEALIPEGSKATVIRTA